MLSMNMSAAPQINTSTDKLVTAANPNSNHKHPSSASSDKQKTAAEKFAQVLEREITGTCSNTESCGKTETGKQDSSAPAKLAESAQNVGAPADSQSSAMVFQAPITPAAQPLFTDVAADTAAFSDGTADLPGMFFDGVPHLAGASKVVSPLSPLTPALTLQTPGLNTETLPALVAAPIMSTASVNPSSSTAGKPVAPPLLPGGTMLSKPALLTSAADDGTFLFGGFEPIMDMAVSAESGKLLPFLPELDEAFLTNNGGSGEPAFSIAAESMPDSLLGITNGVSSTSQQISSHSVQVDQPVGQPKWTGEFAQKIVWLTTQQHQVAEIHLNPAHLGPVEVMLSISQDQATAQFLSPHSAVREAIEQALPRLREMMAENGIQLGNVMVGADSFQQGDKQQPFFSNQADSDASPRGAAAASLNPTETTVVSSRHSGMVNTYA